MNKIEFLKEMDSRVWVKDRIFFTRYIALYALTELPSMLSDLNQVISIIPPATNIIDPIPKFKEEKDLLRIAHLIITKLDLTKIIKEQSSCPFSAVEQFFSDFQVYGLREAVAYLCEVKEISFSEKAVQNTLLDFYGFIGKTFIENLETMKEDYKTVLEIATKGNKQLQTIMPEGYISAEAKVEFMLNPTVLSDFLRKLERQVVAVIDIDSDGALELLTLSECLNFGGYWENGEEQRNFATDI